MTAKTLSKEGYVISSARYQEQDALVTLLTEEGKCAIRLRGGEELKSKNRTAGLIFNLVQVDVSEDLSTKYLTANGTKTLANHTSLYEDLGKSLTGQFACELLLKYFQDQDEMPYKYFGPLLSGLEEGFDPLTLALIFAAQVIKCLGYAPDTSACVDCGKKTDLVAFSLEEGGFLCQECARELNVRPDPTDYLKVMRYVFMVRPEQMTHAVLPKGASGRALNELCLYLQEQLGLEVKSLTLLKEALKIV
jgi:DNA repair protein RecO (recombination protein O)